MNTKDMFKLEFLSAAAILHGLFAEKNLSNTRYFVKPNTLWIPDGFSRKQWFARRKSHHWALSKHYKICSKNFKCCWIFFSSSDTAWDLCREEPFQNTVLSWNTVLTPPQAPAATSRVSLQAAPHHDTFWLLHMMRSACIKMLLAHICLPTETPKSQYYCSFENSTFISRKTVKSLIRKS